MDFQNIGLTGAVTSSAWSLPLLKKAMNAESSSAAQLLEMLPGKSAGTEPPQVPARRISGSVPEIPKGKYIDVYA